MGWEHRDAPGHEGFLVGRVPDRTHADRWRELRSPEDNTDHAKIEVFQVACTCGWRSPRLRAPIGTHWCPYSLVLPELYDDDLSRAGSELWMQHWRLPDALAARAEKRVPRGPEPVARRAGGASDEGRLELVDEPGGLRHFLLGRAVHAGDGLDLLLADGRWLPGRYENVRGEISFGPSSTTTSRAPRRRLTGPAGCRPPPPTSKRRSNCRRTRAFGGRSSRWRRRSAAAAGVWRRLGRYGPRPARREEATWQRSGRNASRPGSRA